MEGARSSDGRRKSRVHGKELGLLTFYDEHFSYFVRKSLNARKLIRRPGLLLPWGTLNSKSKRNRFVFIRVDGLHFH